MGYNPQHLLGPNGQPFVANEAPYTRRTILPLGDCDGSSGPINAYVDFVIRQSFTVPSAPFRYRFRIRNNNCLANTTHAGAYNLTGIYVGTPASSGLTVWNGSFASAPTAAITAQAGSGTGAQTLDPSGTGAEWVTNWNTAPLPLPNQAFAVSLGFNAASSIFNQGLAGPGLAWGAIAGTAVSANVGVTANGSIGGTPLLAYGFLDIRFEYEFIGNNPIGFFVGTSQEGGLINGGGAVFGNVGPDERWPDMIGRRTGHAITNGGISGALASTWAGTPSSSLCYQRFFDTTYPSLVWPGGCTPDYAVISLGVNDASSGVTLATFQANIAATIANLNSLGIYRIFICTVAPSPNFAGWSSGNLQTALAASAHTTVVMNNIFGVAGQTGQVLPGAGYPGPNALWSSANGFWLGTPEMGNLSGLPGNTVPYPITSVAGGGTAYTTLTVPSFTPTNAYVIGDPVLGAWEGYRKIYNNWIRQHVLGTMGSLDLSSISEGLAYVSVYYTGSSFANSPGNFYQGGRAKPEWYGATAGPHPKDPSMYEAWAAAMTPQLIGV